MIRTRLIIAFGALVLIALVQLGFTWWATRAASIQSERSVLAARMLAQYLDLGANKQRLKVWFAQSMLTGESVRSERDLLTSSMERSLATLNRTIEQWQSLTSTQRLSEHEALLLERSTVALLRTNTDALVALLDGTAPLAADVEKTAAWKRAIEVFDQSEGRDMRTLLADAVERQRIASSTSVSALEQEIARIRYAAIALAVLVVLVGLAAMAYFVTKIQRPITRIVDRTNAIAEGDYDVPMASQSRDEFGRIERALNAMRNNLARARERDQSIQSALEQMVAERTRALTESYEALMDQDARRRQFFADIGHEVRTPVTVIRGEAEIALRGGDRSAASYRESLQRIVEASESLTQRSSELIQLARAGLGDRSVDYELHPIAPLLSRAIDQARALAFPRGIDIKCDSDNVSPDITLRCNRPRLEQVFMILLDNAIRYSPDRTIVEVRATVADDRIRIAVCDQGIGFSDTDRRQVFERYFRGERARAIRADGMGLGLAIAHTIVNAHSGEIRIENNTPLGARVIIEIPVHATTDR